MENGKGSQPNLGGEQAQTYDPALIADPYPYYRSLRETDPVHLEGARNTWLLTRYADVAAVLRDDEHFSAEQFTYASSMLTTDPPEHTRLRTLVSKAFTGKRVQDLAPRIQGIVDGLLDAVAGESEMDVIARFAYPLPITVIAELLGVDADRQDFFREASVKLALSLGPVRDPQLMMGAFEGRNDLFAYFDELIARRRAEPRDDLISALIASEESGDGLTYAELLAMLLLLLVGGHETTVNLIGNGLLALLRNPGQLEMLRDDERIEKRAVEELLRYDSPVQYSGRVARDGAVVAGTPIPAGHRVRMMFGAANRDPAVFADPEDLDITREHNPHLAFGSGTHFCLGAQLARLEGRIALSTLVRRLPGARLAKDELKWRPAPVLRGLEALPITW
jgi:cytochrome P450